MDLRNIWKSMELPASGWPLATRRGLSPFSDSNRDLAIKQERSLRKTKSVTVHNERIPDTATEARPDRAGTPRIVMVARFVPQKESARLLAALATIDAPFHLAFVGDVPTRAAAEQLAGDLGLGRASNFWKSNGYRYRFWPAAHRVCACHELGRISHHHS